MLVDRSPFPMPMANLLSFPHRCRCLSALLLPPPMTFGRRGSVAPLLHSIVLWLFLLCFVFLASTVAFPFFVFPTSTRFGGTPDHSNQPNLERNSPCHPALATITGPQLVPPMLILSCRVPARPFWEPGRGKSITHEACMERGKIDG